MRIGVDLMGSDRSPEALFEAVLEVAETLSENDSLVVFLTQDALEKVLSLFSESNDLSEEASKIDFHLVKEVIRSAEDPLASVRRKKDSSLCVGMRQLASHQIDALVSAGNTGALIASARIFLHPMTFIHRPSLLAVLPTKESPLAMLDVGGMVSCSESSLVENAKIGVAFQQCHLGIQRPRVGMLNIGVESKKGRHEVRQAYEILVQLSQEPDAIFQFIGNVEGRDVFDGSVDVLVTDGFTGNVLLKTSEGISGMIFDHLQDAFIEDSSEKLHQKLDKMQRHFCYEEYPGAIVCGVDGLVMKCHGAASKRGLKHSILGAIQLVEHQLIQKIKEQIC